MYIIYIKLYRLKKNLLPIIALLDLREISTCLNFYAVQVVDRYLHYMYVLIREDSQIHSHVHWILTLLPFAACWKLVSEPKAFLTFLGLEEVVTSTYTYTTKDHKNYIAASAEYKYIHVHVNPVFSTIKFKAW